MALCSYKRYIATSYLKYSSVSIVVGNTYALWQCNGSCELFLCEIFKTNKNILLHRFKLTFKLTSI